MKIKFPSFLKKNQLDDIDTNFDKELEQFVAKRISADDLNGNSLSHENELLKMQQVFINPVILNETGDDFVYPEGCLSIPNISENVVRKEKLKIKFLDEKLESQTIICSGIIARVIQHEYDHLQGILFTDKLSYKKRKSLKQELNLISIGDIEVKYKMRFFKKK